MAFKMYKGDSECLADSEQLAVMQNAGWSRTKSAVEEKAPVEQKAEKPVVKKPAVKAEEPKKPAPKKRRSAKKAE